MLEQDQKKKKVRKRQWIYLGPLLAAPFAHIAVTLYRDAKTARQKKIILGVGVVGSTVLSVGMRLYLMKHAGYAGGGREGTIPIDRIVDSSEEEENPTSWSILKKAFKGFL